MGSIREGRAGIKVADWFMKAVESGQNAQVELVDLKEYPLPLFVDAVSPSSREGVHPVPEVEAWLAKLKEADGYIFVTPEYNHSLPGAFKNALDYVYKEVYNKPLGIVSYGALPAGSRAGIYATHFQTKFKKPIAIITLILGAISFISISITGYLGGKIRHTEFDTQSQIQTEQNNNNSGSNKDSKNENELEFEKD